MTVHDIAGRLPEPAVLREHCRAMAVVEAVLSPEWADRRHSFDAHWSATEELASMRDGSGDEYALVLSPAGAFLRGFDHTSPMSPGAGRGPWPGVLDEVPEVFRPCVTEPAFADEDGTPLVTACLWREAGAAAWTAGTIDFPEGGTGDPDGAGHLFRLLADRSPEAFRRWAEGYYEVPVDPAAVRHLFAGLPLTEAVAAALNPERDLADLAADLAEIGPPHR